MTVSIEQLQAFVAAAELGSLRKAADSMGKHASTVSELVANLEIDLGFELFERTRRAIQLTEAGKQMLNYARPVLRETGLFQDKADSLLARQPEKLVIALDASLRCPALFACCQSVQAAFPSLELTVIGGDPFQILSWLRSGQADVAVAPTMMRPSNDCVYSRGFAFKLHRIVGPNIHVTDGSLDGAVVRSLPQIVYKFMLDAGLEQAHVYSHHRVIANNADDVIELVAAGMGWAFVPGLRLEHHLEAKRIQAFEIDNARTEIWFSDILHLDSRGVDPAMQVFIDSVKAIPDML